MGETPAFQNLPGHIIESICYFVGSSHRDQCSRNYSSTQRTRGKSNYNRQPLLGVSQRWRIITQEYLYQNIEIMCQDNEPSIRHLEYNFCCQQLSKKTNNYVKNVTLFLSWTNVFSGKALEMLNQFYPNLTFPRAQHVRVFFLAPYTKTLDNSSQTIHAIDKFTHKVRTMVPHAHSIQATVYSFEYMAVPREFNYCSRVLNNLYSQLRSAEYHGWKNPQWHGMLDDPHTELTSLTYDWMNFGEESYALFYTHARTLQSLRLNSGAAINYNRLFQKPDNSNVVYSQLTRLHIVIESVGLDSYHWKTPNNIVFFPKLRHFSHNQMYPFDDVTIFRGNRDIIKSINIFIGSTSFESLKRHGMFSTNQLCESLQHLSISKEADSLMLGKFELPANMLQNWLAIAPVLQTLNVLVDEPGIRESLISCLPTISCAKTLHMLVIPHISLQFDKMLELLCQLPALTDLHCEYAGLKNSLGHLSSLELINYTRGACSSNQSRLKMWQVVNADAVAENTLALTAMLLAIALPNFTYAAIPPNMRACYEDNLQEYILQVPFVAYATRLKCLFLKGAQLSQVCYDKIVL